MNDDQIMSTIIQTLKEKYSLLISTTFKKYIIDEAVDIENLDLDLEDLTESFLISYMVEIFHWEHDEINRFCLLIRKCLDPNIAELTRMPTCLAKANMPSEYLVRGYLRRIEDEWRNKNLQNYTSNTSIHTPTDEYIDDTFQELSSDINNVSIGRPQINHNISHRLRNSYSSISLSGEKTGDSMSPLLMPFVLARSYSMMTIPEEITRLCVKYLQEICVYAIGRNDRGEFGIPGRRNFTQLTELEWITKEDNFSLFTIIPCTLNGIAYISEDRNLYVCGFNKWAQFGLGHDEHAVEIPTLHEFYKRQGMKISYVSHGQRAYHMFVMTHDGSVYAHGANEWGQLGLNRQQNKEMEPVLMKVETWIVQPKKTVIKQITCGIEHSIFLTSMGDVYSCGRNKWGQLGFGPPCTQILVPTIIPTILECHIDTIECGDSNSYVIDSDKHIWSWGRNEFGELGCGEQDIASRWEPRKIMFFIDNNIPINKLVVGSDHVLVLDEYGKVYSWGFGRFGCCGDGTRKHHYMPIEITALSRFRITDVSCGSTHSIAITDDREIFAWGYNLMNQCCMDTFNETRIITCREIRSPRMVTTAINKLFSPQPNVLGIRTATNSTLFIIENFAFQNYTKNDNEDEDVQMVKSGSGNGGSSVISTHHSNNTNNNMNVDNNDSNTDYDDIYDWNN